MRFIVPQEINIAQIAILKLLFNELSQVKCWFKLFDERGKLEYLGKNLLEQIR